MASEDAANIMGDSMQGAASGASVGTAIAPGIGTAIGAIAGGITGAVKGFFGSRSRKKAAEANRRRLEQISKLIVSKGNRANQYLDDERQFREEQMADIISNYDALVSEYEMAAAQDQVAADAKYGDLLNQVSTSLTRDLGFTEEIWEETTGYIQDMRLTETELVKEDIKNNKAAREAFQKATGQAIEDVETLITDVKTDYEAFKERGGKPAYYDAELSKLSDQFGDIRGQIDEADAGRGRSGLQGRKLTSLFEEAKQRGALSSQMLAQGEEQKGAFQSKLAGLTGTAQDLESALLQGSQTNDGQILAEIENRYGTAALNAYLEKVGSQQGLMSQADRDKLALTQGKYDTATDIRQTLAGNKTTALQTKQTGKQILDERFQGAEKDAYQTQQSLTDQQIALLSGQPKAQSSYQSASGKDIGASIAGLMDVFKGMKDTK